MDERDPSYMYLMPVFGFFQSQLSTTYSHGDERLETILGVLYCGCDRYVYSTVLPRYYLLLL